MRFKEIRQPFLLGVLLLTGFNLFARQNELNVGDIAFDAKTDDPKFQFCNPSFVLQGYELKTSSDESNAWISNQLKQKFVHQVLWKDQSGFITIRFAVNCFGLTDRFRVLGVNNELKSTEFPVDLNIHLIKIVKEIKWPVLTYQMKSIDYYQDVTFKVVNGELRDAIL